MSNLLNAEIRSKLYWMNEPEQWEWTDQGGIIVEAPKGADFFYDPAGNYISISAPFLYTLVRESFEMRTQLTVGMRKKYDSGCLMLLADEKNWCKLCFEFNGEAATIVSIVTKEGQSDDCNSVEVHVTNPYLKIRKVEDCVSFFYSPDGEDWRLIRYFGMHIPGGGKAGIVAQSPHGIGSSIHFMNLIVTEPELVNRF